MCSFIKLRTRWWTSDAIQWLLVRCVSRVHRLLCTRHPVAMDAGSDAPVLQPVLRQPVCHSVKFLVEFSLFNTLAYS